ncbi:hypothetical protein LPJ64_001826 [Coemansia asiatica]|uniref:Cation-transporting P-type ATPase C-terminal domain-containing protein n=1 Tax=Coemansia asiatica TaxID=1052880 RepID=A0A9W8CL37_9FUNG|nr:hypothetical protein LPJ64_001826 [Coemansia asiatica]
MNEPPQQGLSTETAKKRLLAVIDKGCLTITVDSHFDKSSTSLLVVLGTTAATVVMLLVSGVYILLKGEPVQSRAIVSIVETGLLVLSVAFTGWILWREESLEKYELDTRLRAIAHEIRGWAGTYGELRTPQLPTVTTYMTMRDGAWKDVPTLLLVEGDVIALGVGETAPCHIEQRDCEQEALMLTRGQKLVNLWTGKGSSRTMFDVRDTPLRYHLEQIALHHRRTDRSVLQNQLCKVIHMCVRRVLPAFLLAALVANAVIYGVVGVKQQKLYHMVVEVIVGKTAYVLFPFACTALWPVFWILARIFASSCVVVLFDTLQRSKTEYEDMEDIDEFDVEALPPTKDIKVGMNAIIERMQWMWTSCDFRNLSRSSNLAETLGNITVICSIDKEGTIAEPICTPEQIVVPDQDDDYAILDLGEQQVGLETRTIIIDDGWEKYLSSLRALGLGCIMRPKRRRMRRHGKVLAAQDTNLRKIGLAIGFVNDDIARFSTERELYVFSRDIRDADGLSAASLTATMIDSADGGKQILIDGNFELVLGMCLDYFDGSAIHKLDDEKMAIYYGLYQNSLQQDLQCLAFAYCPDDRTNRTSCASSNNDSNGYGIDTKEAFIGLDHGSNNSLIAQSLASSDLPEYLTEMTRKRLFAEDRAFVGQTFLGLVTFAYDPKTDVCDFIEDLSIAGIRFVYFSASSGRQSKAFGERLGLETDWNTCILLSSADGADDGGYIEDHDIKARLPRGIESIRPHLAEVDDIPLQISLFAECAPDSTREMIRIFQENGDVACCIGSALADANTLTFAAADLAVGVEPIPHFNGRGADNDWTNDGSISTSGALATQYALGAALTCIPCPLFLQHDTSLYTLLQVVSEARRLVGSLGLGATLLAGTAVAASAVNLVSNLCLLPPAMDGLMLIWVLWVVAPLLAASLLFAPHDEATMSTMPVKNHAHMADMPRFAIYAAVRMLPPVALTVAVYATALHALVPIPVFGKLDWLTLSSEHQAALWSSQVLATTAFVFHCVLVSSTLMHRTRPTTELLPFRNIAWVIASVLILALTFAASALLLPLGLGKHADLSRVPWYTYVIGLVGPLVLLPLQDMCKLHDRKRWTRLQKLAKLEFKTKLGLHSPL